MRVATTSIVCSFALLQSCTVKDYTFLNVSSITVSPSNPAIPIGATQQFTATGTLADGSTQDVSGVVTWSSSNPSVATIDGSGTASGLAEGSTTIQARSGSAMASTELTIRNLVALTSIVIAPANPSLPIGETQQFTATGMFSDGSTVDLTRSATWSSSDSTVASIDAFGLARGLRSGTTTIQATSGGINGSTQLRVVSLISIAVTPANPTIALGGTQQFTATGTYSDGTTTRNLTTSVTWTSSLTTVATISASGLATGTGLGATTIRAALGSIEGTTTLTVRGLLSIMVNHPNPSILMSDTEQFHAIGHFNTGPDEDITQSVAWSSDATSVVTFLAPPNPAGLARGVGPGMTTIRARSGSVEGTASISVTGPTSIAVTPAAASIAVLGGTQQFTATGTFPGGATRNLTELVTWSSTNTTVATVNPSGRATGLAYGGTTIQAASGSIPPASTGLTVGLVSIAITPLTASIRVTQTQQFTAMGTFTSGPQQNITPYVAWSSSMPAVATINASGLASGLSVGTTMIGARSGTIMQTAAATLTVTP